MRPQERTSGSNSRASGRRRMTPKALIWTIVAVALAIAIPLGAYAAGGSGAQSDDTATSSPATKTLTDNGDGTYDLAINVTGKSSSTSEQSVKPVDIVLVLDVSGSMDENITSYSYSPISGSPSTRNTYYVQASDGSYVRVSYSWWYGWRGDDGNTYDSSTTQFYSRSETSSTSKLAALKSAVNGFLDSTASQNEKIEDENSKIRVSIVKFAGTKKSEVGNDTYGQNEYNNSQIVNNLTSDMSALQSSVRALRAGGATSADYGMELASSELSRARADADTARADADTYVIFFTDGEPNHSNGFDDSVANSAISTAKTLKNSGTTIYSIGVLSGANPSADPTNQSTSKANMYLQAMSSNYPYATGYTSLGSGDYTSGYYKAASSSEELSSIFDDIFSNISSTTTISNVSLTDNLTSMTATSLVNGEAGNFTYTKTDATGTTSELTGFPEASYQNGTITWNLGNTVLENGVTYTVHAKVWPSQTALDLVADLNNGAKTYGGLTDAEKAQLKQNADGTYTLNTNPDEGNTVTYTEVTTKTSSQQPAGTVNDDGSVTGNDGYTYTKNDDGTWTGTKADASATTSNIVNPSNGMPVSNQQVSFEKIWEGGTTTQTLLTAELQRDCSDYVSVTVTSDHNWTTTTNVAMGIIDGSGTALESGHDYTVVEPSADYHFEYSGEIYRPMLIKNVPTVLVKIAGQEEGAYQIDGSWYKPAAATSTLTATNIRKSTLNLSKSVVDNSANSDVPADALFTFTASVTDSKASDGNVWFSIVDASGNTVKDADRVSGATAESSDTGYYFAASGSTITLKLKDRKSVV